MKNDPMQETLHAAETAEYAESVREDLDAIGIRHIHLADECLQPLIELKRERYLATLEVDLWKRIAQSKFDEKTALGTRSRIAEKAAPMLEHLAETAKDAERALSRFSTAYLVAAIGQENRNIENATIEITDPCYGPRECCWPDCDCAAPHCENRGFFSETRDEAETPERRKPENLENGEPVSVSIEITGGRPGDIYHFRQNPLEL